MSDVVTIYSDGACSGNPGPGGYGAVILFGRHEKCICGYVGHTTNQRMELTAGLVALQHLKRPCRVQVISDSQYLIKGASEWLDNWIRSGRLDGGDVANADLWLEIVQQIEKHLAISWSWVKGHSGHPRQEQADQLARSAIGQNLNPDTYWDNIAQESPAAVS